MRGSKGQLPSFRRNTTSTRSLFIVCISAALMVLVVSFAMLSPTGVQVNDKYIISSPKTGNSPSSSSNNSTSSPNSSSSSPNNDGDNETFALFDQHWPEMKQAMCPNMTPNPKVWRVIFHLARQQLNFADSINIQEQLFDDFFRFSFGGIGYISNGNHNHKENSNGNNNEFDDDDEEEEEEEEEDQLATIYLKIWKCGNMFIQDNIGKIFLEKYPNETAYYNEDVQMSLYTKLKLVQVQQQKQKQQQQQRPCIVTAVRDPISHFISAYNEIEFRNQLYKDENHIPSRTDIPLLFTRYDLGSTQRFAQFVADFLGGPSHYGWFSIEVELPHLYSMTGILYEQQRINHCHGTNLTLTAYLPSLSNLKYTFPKLLKDTCDVPAAGLPPELLEPYELEYNHGSQLMASTYGFVKAGKEIWAQGGDTARALCALHVLDYACYDAIPVPALCKRVFAHEDFRRQIFVAADNDDDHIVREQCG